MTDAECRRRAVTLASQLPVASKDRRRIIEHLKTLIPFLDGEDLTEGRTGDGPKSGPNCS